MEMVGVSGGSLQWQLSVVGKFSLEGHCFGLFTLRKKVQMLFISLPPSYCH